LPFFLAVGSGRRQVFNEYFHSLPAVWRDSAAACGVEHGCGIGGGGERKGAEWGKGRGLRAGEV
jgi:hypothetical protein